MSQVTKGFIITDPAFLDSLKINTSIYFKKYFEDCAAHLTDIHSKSPIEITCQRAAAIEGIIGASVRQKIDALERFEQDNIEIQKQVEFSKISRKLFLFLVNELYELLGILEKKDYKEDLMELQNSTFSHPNSKYIIELFSAYINNTQLPDSISGTPDWLLECREFIEFLIDQKKIKGKSLPEHTKILLSGDSNGIQLIQAKVSQEINTSKDAYLIINNSSNVADYRIWPCSTVFWVLTKESSINEENQLIKKAKLYGKDIVLLVESGVDTHSLEKTVNASQIINFDRNNLNDLNLKIVLETAKKKHITALIIGWLNLIDKKAACCSCVLNFHSSNEKDVFLDRSQWLGLDQAQYLSKKNIKSALAVNERRKLRNLQHIKVTNKKKFQGNIHSIIKKLMPSLSDESVNQAFTKYHN